MNFLRELKESDAPFMLEWMHDCDVTCYLSKDFSNMTIDDCISFIHASQKSSDSVHLAVVDNQDTYLGTVSLKNIDHNYMAAEFAITIRRQAMHTGVSSLAMESMLNIGFKKYKLKMIYWYVDIKNVRAIKFYDKSGYQRIDLGALKVPVEEELKSDKYLWYCVENNKN